MNKIIKVFKPINYLVYCCELWYNEEYIETFYTRNKRDIKQHAIKLNIKEIKYN